MANLGIFTIEGVDATSFLQGYVTSDLDFIESQSGTPTALTDIKGRVLANGWHYGHKEKVSLVVHSSLLEPVSQHLNRYMVFSKSTLSQVSNDMDLSLIEHPNSIVLNPMGWHLHRRESTEPNWPKMTLEARYPLVTDVTSGSFLPQMLSLTDYGAVSFTKGCYLGQEIVARAQHRGAVKRHLRAFSFSEGSIDVGTKVVGAKGKRGVVVATYSGYALVVTGDDVDALKTENGTQLLQVSL